MILRINEFDPANAEPYSGWASCPLRGGIGFDWSSEAHAFEVLILDSDENRQSLSNTFRQARLRELLPELVAALVEPLDHLVLRLDGPLAPGEMIAAYRHLCDVDGDGRFAISGVQRVDPLAPAAIGSVRIELTARRLTQMCAEHSLGIEREVRLRLFAVPDELVAPLLDITELDDERWAEILPRSGFVLQSVRSLQAIQVITNRLDRVTMRNRLTQRLTGNATTISQSW